MNWEDGNAGSDHHPWMARSEKAMLIPGLVIQPVLAKLLIEAAVDLRCPLRSTRFLTGLPRETPSNPINPSTPATRRRLEVWRPLEIQIGQIRIRISRRLTHRFVCIRGGCSRPNRQLDACRWGRTYRNIALRNKTLRNEYLGAGYQWWRGTRRQACDDAGTTI